MPAIKFIHDKVSCDCTRATIYRSRALFLHANRIVIHKHGTEKPVTTMLTYPWKCTVLHCNHLGNTWKRLVLITWHSDYCPSASEGDNQSVRSSAPVVSRCFPGGYNAKLYISRGRLAWWLLAFLHSEGPFKRCRQSSDCRCLFYPSHRGLCRYK